MVTQKKATNNDDDDFERGSTKDIRIPHHDITDEHEEVDEVLQDIRIPHHDIMDEHEEDDEVLQDIRIPHHDITDEHEEDDDDDNELHSSPTGDTVCWSKSRYSMYDRQTPCVPKDMVKSCRR